MKKEDQTESRETNNCCELRKHIICLPTSEFIRKVHTTIVQPFSMKDIENLGF